MFVDEAQIYVRGGDGGRGCVSFCRERFRPKGGPDGGNGGRGGSVYAVATEGVETLLDFASKHHWIAGTGRGGQGARCTGHDGADVHIQLPAGTLVYDRDTGILLKDLTEYGEPVCMAAGGIGGRGNKAFATPTNQAPREAEAGQPAQERWLRLELKLIADVGLVGLPNAGKSTLLSCLSRATPKIADYPFTTLRPQLGIAELSGFRRLVLADIPGLVEGAHEGTGLGDAFLRHIERTRIIVHVIDMVPPEGSPAPVEAYETIRNELAKFSAALAEKPEIIVANKMDLTGAGEGVQTLREHVGGRIWPISAVARLGLNELTENMWKLVQEQRPAPASSPEPETAAPHSELNP